MTFYHTVLCAILVCVFIGEPLSSGIMMSTATVTQQKQSRQAAPTTTQPCKEGQKITCTWTNGNIRMTCFETCGQKALLISKKCKGKMSLRNQGFAVECVNNFQNKGSYPSSGSCSCSVEKCPRKLICTDELL